MAEGAERTGRGASVLVVDDDAAVAKVLLALLAQAKLEAMHASSAEAALQLLARHPVEVVITDLRMPGMDGMQLLERIKLEHATTPVIILTAHGTVPLAVEAMRAGAADFVLKPFDRDELLYVVRKALHRAEHEVQTPGFAEPRSPALSNASPAMRPVLELIRRSAPGSATVLISGESGTGKELAARAIHDLGPRRDGPFVALHCAALPSALLESELFGHEKGAFTGAVCRKPGRFELADRGTLFLDEIGEISPEVQVKLLRVLQERRFERLGGTVSVAVDVRVVSATHRDLAALVREGRFRDDLYYRLNVVPIGLPPLRARPEDIAALAAQFCAELGPKNQKPGARLEPAAVALLLAQPWPGNVRELHNFIERLVLLSDQPLLGAADVERELARKPLLFEPAPPAAGPEARTLEQHRRAAEREAVQRALERSDNNRALAARLLGVSRRTLYNKLLELGLS